MIFPFKRKPRVEVEKTEPTLRMLVAMEETDWFAHIGEPVDKSVVVVHSWEQAAAHCQHELWSNIWLELKNQVARTVRCTCRVEFDSHWNDHATLAKAIAEPLVKKKLNKQIKAKQLPDWLPREIISDLVMILIELQYQPITQGPLFWEEISQWYLRGRFPCGWDGTHEEGQLPVGRLIIY